MDEQFQGGTVKVVGLGKRQRLAHKAGQTLAQGVVPKLDKHKHMLHICPVAVVGTAQFPLFPLFGKTWAGSQGDCI